MADLAPRAGAVRPAGSAVWRLTLAFAAPLILGAVVLVLGAYAVMVQADVAALRPAILSDAAVLRSRILDSEKALAAPTVGASFDAPASITQAMLSGRLARQQTDRQAGLPVTSFYLYAYQGQVVDGDKGFGEPRPLACGLAPGDWVQCLEAAGLGGAGGWYRVTDADGDAWGLARRIDVSPGQDGAHGHLYVGRQFAMAEVERRLLNVAAAVLGLACLAAVLLGLLVSRQMLRRVEAVNAVCDRVRQGDLAARAGGAEADDEFGALSRHVNDMLEQIAALVLGLRDVSNRIAHDLRTPIARLKADLERAAAAPDLDAAQAGAEAAAAETEVILETFQALLDIAEAEAGADGGLQPIRLDDAARGAVDLYEAVAEEAGVTLVAELEPAPLLGEPSLVVRLAANLVDNAIKFSPPGGRVVVRTVRAGSEVVLSVSDQGPGIPAGERQAVLRRFVRAEATRATPGHGLGLALVAAVAKRHGAKIRMDDTVPAPGLTVSVTFRAF
ncbi:ATP-binding protein [Caulobacter sp. KR2-114]|uniref:sensor histidine kinase n=1 Tax=Caulobacter sp. KR2-114 TaxID=3400912 RepID=UPI003C03B246